MTRNDDVGLCASCLALPKRRRGVLRVGCGMRVSDSWPCGATVRVPGCWEDACSWTHFTSDSASTSHVSTRLNHRSSLAVAPA